MTLDEAIKILTQDDYGDWCRAYDKAVQVVKQLSSLESEYNAYHTDSDYWKGIKYAIDVLNHERGTYMTNEEAIKIVRGESIGHPVSCDEQINAAKCVADYAERYLKQKEVLEKIKKEITNNNIADFIAVQSVLDIINKHTKG